jgi:hypothetical protein
MTIDPSYEEVPLDIPIETEEDPPQKPIDPLLFEEDDDYLPFDDADNVSPNPL